jgi:hypothetical protein
MKIEYAFLPRKARAALKELHKWVLETEGRVEILGYQISQYAWGTEIEAVLQVEKDGRGLGITHATLQD